MKKSGKKVCMDKSEFKGEHRRLIKLLRSGKGKKFKHEADEQEEEMKKYKESRLLELGAATAVGLMGAARRAGPTPRGKRALAIATRLNDKREKKAIGLRSQALRMSSPLIAVGIELREGAGRWAKRKVLGESQLLELSPELKARAADAAVKKGAEHIRKALGARGTPDFQRYTNSAARKSRQFLRFRGKKVAESSPLTRALKTGAALVGAGAAGYGAYKLARSGVPQLMRANRIGNRGERETLRKLRRFTDRVSRVSKLTRGNYRYVNDFLRRRLGPKSATIRTAAKYDRLSNAVGVPGFAKMVGAGGLLAAGAGLGAYALAHRNPNRR